LPAALGANLCDSPYAHVGPSQGGGGGEGGEGGDGGGLGGLCAAAGRAPSSALHAARASSARAVPRAAAPLRLGIAGTQACAAQPSRVRHARHALRLVWLVGRSALSRDAHVPHGVREELPAGSAAAAVPHACEDGRTTGLVRVWERRSATRAASRPPLRAMAAPCTTRVGHRGTRSRKRALDSLPSPPMPSARGCAPHRARGAAAAAGCVQRRLRARRHARCQRNAQRASHATRARAPRRSAACRPVRVRQATSVAARRPLRMWASGSVMKVCRACALRGCGVRAGRSRPRRAGPRVHPGGTHALSHAPR
jgi:hypothetical protein